MGDLRSEETEYRTDPALPEEGGPPTGGEDPRPVPDDEHEPRRRGRILIPVLATLGLLGGAAGLLVWTGDAKPLIQDARRLAQEVRWYFDPPPPVDVTVHPMDRQTEIRLDATVRVTATDGRLTRVTVTGEDGTRLDGTMSPDGRLWESGGTLTPDTRYRVRWEAVNPNDTERRNTATFTTLTPTEQLEIDSITPLDGSTVGVGQPLVVRFSHPVENKAAVERALEVDSSAHLVGAWNWFADDVVRFRAQDYWPAYSSVTLTAHLTGVNAGEGLWGLEDTSISFDIGASQISTVNVDTHTMTVEIDGEVVRELPISAGMPGWETQNGVHTVLGFRESMIMDSASYGRPGLYRTRVEWAVRLTNSGEFVHSAPWSVGAQGYANVSHGCINLSPANAVWFFKMAQLGDVVEVVGSPEPPGQTAGLLEWNMSFAEWREGSALPTPRGRAQPA